MNRILATIQKTTCRFLLLPVLAGAMASCDSVLNYDEGDCSIEYSVKFKYDYNIEEVDAFSKLVRTVTLYAFDENGNLVYRKTDEGEQLGDADYTMKVDIDASKYHLIAWAGLNDESFAVPLLTPKQSKKEDLTVLTLRKNSNLTSQTAAESEEGKYIVDNELHALWHGEVKNAVATRSGRESVTTVSLVKNTNNIRIVVAQVNQSDQPIPPTRVINKNSLKCAIYDDNGHMNYDNTLLPDNVLTYQPFVTDMNTVTSRAFQTNGQPTEEGDSGAQQQFNAVVSEISVARLLTSQTPRLSIKNSVTGEMLFSNKNLIEFLELLRLEQYKNKYGLQEYLDREDNFSMIFFVNEKMALINSVIEINGWIIHLKDIEL